MAQGNMKVGIWWQDDKWSAGQHRLGEIVVASIKVIVYQ